MEKSRILDRMVERLYASLATGPVLACRPHASRQRIDVAQVGVLAEREPGEIVRALLGDEREIKLSARGGDEDRAAILGKLRTIAEDARTYEQDTGAQVLYVGFPLLDVPPAGGVKHEAFTKRILAPICFVPIQLAVRTTRPASVTVTCAREGAERVIPNAALIAWIEQTTGKQLDLDDEDGAEDDTQTWREVADITRRVCEALDIAPLDVGPEMAIAATPKADESKEPRVVASAVLGLFPVSNQNLLKDLEALAAGEVPDGPIQSFLRADRALAADADRAPRDIRTERLVAQADPCQARAVRYAGHERGLVIHGPPGTGKSQTIANIVGAHLARGERVLFVCDKRTALDVVEHRLSHLGLGHLCAVIHDVQRDQRDLYRSVREQLEGLAEAKSDGDAARQLDAVDALLVKQHAELRRFHDAVARGDGEEPSFHALAGEWLAIDAPDVAVDGVKRAELLALEPDVHEVFARGAAEDAPGNPWLDATSLPLAAYLAQPATAWKTALAQARIAALAADATRDDAIAPFDDGDLAAQGAARAKLAEDLAATALADAAPAQDAAKIAKALASLDALDAQVARLETATPEPELALVVKSQKSGAGDIAQWIGTLTSYLAIARAWYRWFCFGRRKAARDIAQRFGLALGPEPAERLEAFLAAERARRVVEAWHEETLHAPFTGDDLAATARAYARRWRALLAVHRDPVWAGAKAQVLAMLAADRARLATGLARAATRCPALQALEAALSNELFAPAWRAAIAKAARAGEAVADRLAALEERFGSLEGVLRMKKALAALPAVIAGAAEKLARSGATPDAGWAAIRRGVLAAELRARTSADPTLLEIDSDRMASLHRSYRDLEGKKRALVRDAIVHRWTDRQRERLLASTGSRLNGAGAELKRRLTLRGEKAMRMRQVIAAGAGHEGGDPLFDLRPVWMASPETVAQIFPREALFDVVVFDEASQCRLEEALPVLLRARRVVIAGDPKQLPPTRFFESSVARSETDADDLTEQGLFEEQQADVEDLLGAALNLEIEQCYLDVHYRSTNADLIEFSNKNFYEARLQAIPGHPKNRAVHAPLRLVRVAGVYDKRANPVEATAVVGIVKELLARAEPPSIGIACFNLVQRDAIVDALDEAAAEDADFAAALATARTRTGAASFEGLFVKNLENVQGDERDHIIISTTYGPDPKGRFYRRFGPLARAGGGRRLNVLVTRARAEVHLVTSIPADVYAALPPVEAGKSPNGAWLLFSYLQYAEQLERAYADEATDRAATKPAGTVRTLATRTPSPLVAAMARRVAENHGLTSDVYWGNDGFCVDLAIHHPVRADDVSIGVLCDGTRYDKVDDPVEWDLFRTAVLAAQGWTLLRVWSPHVVRDRDAVQAAIRAAAAKELQRESSPTTPPPPPPAPLPTARLLD